ncbi:MAG: hypothetical protein EBS05_13105 [Proteobacteria bacterium]|nr:hypothetical protein [Pseudomonadota bacterium]
MSELPANASLPELLAFANERQTAEDSAAALAAYERALPLLTRAEFPKERALVLFQAAQLARFEGHVARAFGLYDELIVLAAELADGRAHGLAVAMRGQLTFVQGDKSGGIQGMVRGLEELRECGATEADHLGCHTRFFSRRLTRAEFKRCVETATEDSELRQFLLAKD